MIIGHDDPSRNEAAKSQRNCHEIWRDGVDFIWFYPVSRVHYSITGE